jgi:hypothetical protein
MPHATSYTRQVPASSAEDRTMNTWKHSFKSARRPPSTGTRRLEVIYTVGRAFSDERK